MSSWEVYGHVCTLQAWQLLLTSVLAIIHLASLLRLCDLILACTSQLMCCSHCTFETVTSCSFLSCCHGCLCPEDLIDHCLHHWGDSVPPGSIRSLRQHHWGQSLHQPGGGWSPYYATVGHICHRLLHQLCHYHDPQPYVWESGRLDHWHGWGSEWDSKSQITQSLFNNYVFDNDPWNCVRNMFLFWFMF